MRKRTDNSGGGEGGIMNMGRRGMRRTGGWSRKEVGRGRRKERRGRRREGGRDGRA